jgi:hypothetical protein
MRRTRASIAFLGLVFALSGAFAAPAWAQELPKLQTESPAPGGYCAPWHRCAAYLSVGLAAGIVAIFGLGYVIQSRGFHTMEHRQGNPDGVPVEKP